MFVHTEKSYESYNFLTLLKLDPKLVNITTVGTVGEQAIEKALKAVFGEKMINLWCFIHMKDNICQNLSELLLPEKVREEIFRDIFGHQQGTVYGKGLLDAESPADFNLCLSKLESKWDDLEVSVHPQRGPQVHGWILKMKQMF